MCDKVPYGYAEAHRLINVAHCHHHRGRKIPKRVYYCEECRQWHLTSVARKWEVSK
jgi:hypothetical protein